ncbi:MAG TPA: DUF1761 domain-containing protein [Actinomycetota bacterium]|nr:DUF1761 domain-containing protein [Actinomycetota bacterium]
MSFEVLGDLNWLAVIVATIVYFAIGGIWFANAFLGKAWQRAGGFEIPADQRPGPAYFIGPFITCLLTTIAVAMLAKASGTDTVGEGLVLGLVTGVGIAAAVVAVTGLFDPQKANPRTWVAISAGYHVVSLLVVGVLLAVWD